MCTLYRYCIKTVNMLMVRLLRQMLLPALMMEVRLCRVSLRPSCDIYFHTAVEFHSLISLKF